MSRVLQGDTYVHTFSVLPGFQIISNYHERHHFFCHFLSRPLALAYPWTRGLRTGVGFRANKPPRGKPIAILEDLQGLLFFDPLPAPLK